MRLDRLAADQHGKEDLVTTATLIDTDVRLRNAVMRQLDWDPEMDASAVGVAAARGGTVTLTGYIESYASKLGAERAAKRVFGVRAVTNDIEVRLRLVRTDVDIAEDAVRALELRGTVPASVQAAVHNAAITLTGNVGWLFQKRDAAKAVRHIRGVRSVLNDISVTPHAVAHDVCAHIGESLHQNADIDARYIYVAFDGDTATLAGTVGTWLQRGSAEHAAANTPGVGQVENRIVVEPPHESFDVPDEICETSDLDDNLAALSCHQASRPAVLMASRACPHK